MSIEIKKIDRNNKKELHEFLTLPIWLYGDTAVTRNAILKTEGLLRVPYDVGLYIVRTTSQAGSRTIGRMALCVNPGIRDEDGKPYGQVGLFEVIEDFDICRTMLDFAKKEFTGVSSLLFPFYISTWYQYRFITHADSYFFFEIPNKAYYPEFAKRYGVDKTYTYISVFTRAFDQNLHGLKKYEKLMQEGYTLRNIDKRRFREEMRLIYDLSIKSFKDNRFYTDIKFDEFLAFYQGSWRMIDESLFVIAMHGDKPVGFCFASPDYTPFFEKMDMHSPLNKLRLFLSRHRAKGFIYKSGAALPEYRRLGLALAMAYSLVMVAQQKGYQQIIMAFSDIENYPPSIMHGIEKKNYYDLYTIKI